MCTLVLAAPRGQARGRGCAAHHRAARRQARIVVHVQRVAGHLGLLALLGVAACLRPPQAATRAVRSRSIDDLASLPAAERQAHVLARSCERGDVGACERLGSAYWSGYGVKQHRFHALSLWEYACGRDIGTACEQAALVYLDGALVKADPERAEGLYERGCGAGRARACTELGELAASGTTHEPSARRAAKWWRKGCEAGDPRSCHLLGLAVLDGRSAGQDTDEGIEMLTEACAARYAPSCSQLADFHRAGVFVERSELSAEANDRRACEFGDGESCTELGVRARAAGRNEDARAHLTAACEQADPRGCALLGDLHGLGADGIPVDAERSAKAYGAACRGGLFEACGRAAAVQGAAGIDPAELRSLYRVACDAGAVDACDYLAGMLLDGVGGPADPQAAARLFDRACIGAYADSCVHLAWMGRGDHGREPLHWLERACDLDDRACVVLGEVHELGLVAGARLGAAADAYQRGCAGDRSDACFHLGGVLARGAGVPRDDAAAARLYEVACDGGYSDACAALALAYTEGVGVSVDATSASHFRGLACRLGSTAACTKLPTK